MTHVHPVTALLQAGVADRVFPGAVLHVRVGGHVVYEQAVGRLTYDPHSPAVSPDIVYDLASLTKPLVTTLGVLHLLEQGRLDLQQPIGAHWAAVASTEIGMASCEQVLAHATGLPAWRAFYERLAPVPGEGWNSTQRATAIRQVCQWIVDEPLASPPGARSLYSDLGFMLLGFFLEHLLGMPLDVWWRQERPAVRHLRAVDFIDRPRTVEQVFGSGALVAPTECDPWRGRLLCGEVHDENAWSLGGVAGHAGLFGTADAVGELGQWWLDQRAAHETTARSAWVRRLTARVLGISGSSRALGWDTPSLPSSSGQYFSAQAFGHLGFTGTSLWMDPEAGLLVVLLSNRVHPSRANEQIRAFRPRLHDAVYQAWG